MANAAYPATDTTDRRRYRRRRSDRPSLFWRGLRRLLAAMLALVCALLLAAAGYAAWRLMPDRPVPYTDPESHFKYGSIGSERVTGIPLWVWQVLPRVCPDLLPAPADPERPYAGLGLIYEPGHALPVGISERRYLGIDQVARNCALCHAGRLQAAGQDAPRVVAGMPANTLDLQGLDRFLSACAADPRFSADAIIPLIDAMAGGLGIIDRHVVYPLAIWWSRDRLLSHRDGLDAADGAPAWGRGRMDTVSLAKSRLGFPRSRIPPEQRVGVVDPPSLWLQQARATMQLNWDGNNDSVLERARACAFNSGAPLTTLDLPALRRVEEWLRDLPPPNFPFPVDQALAGRGRVLYQRLCASCHGTNGRDFAGARVGTVIPIAELRTERSRLDAYTEALALNQATDRTRNKNGRFTRFRKTFGYAAPPLDGIWLRAPYLHNGSVPTLRDLLEPAPQRPQRFVRGIDRYDRNRVGFVATADNDSQAAVSNFDTRLRGNGNSGHSGAAYGTDLEPEDKDALVEYLKSF